MKSVHLEKVEGDERLNSRVRDLYEALALPVCSQKDLCKDLITYFEHQREINREDLSPARAAVLRALYLFIHTHPDTVDWSNMEIATEANLFPEKLNLNAHQVGRALTFFGINDRRRTNVRYKLWLNAVTRRHIHKAAHDYDIEKDFFLQFKTHHIECAMCEG